MSVSSTTPEPLDLEAVYGRLRRIAQKLLSGERDGHTLSATDVVHEALGRLLASGEPVPSQPQDFVRFVQHAARAMTEVLIDYARRRKALKRGSGRARVRLEDLNDVEATLDRPDFDWAALQAALDDLQVVDPRRHQVVILRFFAGLDNRQIARQLGVNERTIGRDFAAARLWLKEKLAQEQ
ncbi:MAG: ECF-type sigma factor [Phycisphaerae bacterium]|nr:ECF-type sigma factor [Phycisphaerae bacterium]MDW8262041.1 ECF-type sigma factor [Phycisphaerales bacterium]